MCNSRMETMEATMEATAEMMVEEEDEEDGPGGFTAVVVVECRGWGKRG